MRPRLLPLLVLLVACSGGGEDGKKKDGEAPFRFDWPAEGPELRGNGGPDVFFGKNELWTNCATLPGGEEDFDHHNLVMPYRGHLVMPWAAEWGIGGLSFFDMSDPCFPEKVSDSYEQQMRETHAIGFVHLPEGDEHAGDYAVVNAVNGVLIWDITDVDNPVVASIVEIPDVFWPDAYARVTLSIFLAYPWVYAANADNGIAVVNMLDPYAPELVAEHDFKPGLRAGGVFVLGNSMLVTAAKEVNQALLDVSVPDQPQVRGRFDLIDAEGEPVEPYHANLTGPWALFARKSGGGGPIIYDVTDPLAPVHVGEYKNTEGSGGYVFYDEGFVFQGESSFGAVYDATDMSEITMKGRLDLAGDLDTVTPYGNVAILAVDDEAEFGQATVVTPWLREPDTAAPEVLRVDPPDGAKGIPQTARVGIGFNEPIEPSTVFPGSIQLFDADGNAVDGWGSAQEAIAHYVPKEPLLPGTTYNVVVKADGITDINGNPVEFDVTSTFTTAD